MWPARLNAIAGARRESYVLLRALQKQSDISLYRIEGVVDLSVKVPWYFLSGRNLKLANSEAGPLAVVSTTFDFIQVAGIFHRVFLFHSSSSAYRRSGSERVAENVY